MKMVGEYDPHWKVIQLCEHSVGTKTEDNGGKCDEGLRKQGNQSGTKADGRREGEMHAKKMCPIALSVNKVG